MNYQDLCKEKVLDDDTQVDMGDDGELVAVVEEDVSNYAQANSYENIKAYCYDNLNENIAISQG